MKNLLAIIFISASLALPAVSYAADTSTVHFYRPDQNGKAGRTEFYVLKGTRVVAKLNKGKYLTKELPTGEYTFRSSLPYSDSLQLKIDEPGKTYYVQSIVERAEGRYATRYKVVDNTIALTDLGGAEGLN